MSRFSTHRTDSKPTDPGLTESKTKDDGIKITAIESTSSIETDQVAKNPFLDPKVEEYYRQLYSESKYECYDAFDPGYEWTEEEERKVVKKLNSCIGCMHYVCRFTS